MCCACRGLVQFFLPACAWPCCNVQLPREPVREHTPPASPGAAFATSASHSRRFGGRFTGHCCLAPCLLAAAPARCRRAKTLLLRLVHQASHTSINLACTRGLRLVLSFNTLATLTLVHHNTTRSGAQHARGAGSLRFGKAFVCVEVSLIHAQLQG